MTGYYIAGFCLFLLLALFLWSKGGNNNRKDF